VEQSMLNSYTMCIREGTGISVSCLWKRRGAGIY